PRLRSLSGLWDPERWFLGKRRGGTTPPVTGEDKRERLDSEGGSGEPLGGPKRRNPPDPKERLAREERDDLVLSPQRRSFGTGCHVPQPSAPPDGGSKDGDGLAHREPSRRIGSGRILRDQRDWDRENREYGYGGRRFEDTSHAGGHSGRYGNDRRRGEATSLVGRDERIEEEEEPEWFVGGPTSQHDTIELVGFEEDPEGGRRAGRRSRRSREFARKQQQQQPTPAQNGGSRKSSKSDQAAGVTSSTPRTSSPTLPDGVAAAPPALPPQDGFDLNEIFKADWCPQFLSEEPLEGPPAGGSRFSQWFRRDSPPPQGDQGGGGGESRRSSSVHDDLMARVLASGSGEGGLRLPSPDSYFTPISPALPRDHGDPHQHHPYGVHQLQQYQMRLSPPPHLQARGQKNILDILMDANINVEAHLLNGDAAKTQQLREHALSGKAKSVAELEADLKQVVLGGGGGGGNKRGPMQHHGQQQQQQGIPPIPAVPERALQEEDLLRVAYGHQAHMAMHGGEPRFVYSLFLKAECFMGTTWHLSALRAKALCNRKRVTEKGVMRKGQQQQQPALLAQLLQQPKPQGGCGPSGPEMLMKMLGAHRVGPVSPGLPLHPPLSPTPLAPHMVTRHDHMAGECLLFSLCVHFFAAAAAATMLRQQQQHQQQQQEMLQNLLKPPLLTTQRPSPTQQLGLLAPGPMVGASCQSPLPQDPRRVPSPLVFGQHPSPIPPAGTPNAVASGQSSNTLQVHVSTAGLRPRVPSPQELAVHTQSILQTALIKKILEEQKHKENLRKQQEAQRTRSPTLPQGVANNRGASPSKGLSPTMATFTPTSVMRKMHLEQRQDHPKAGPGGPQQDKGPKTNGTEECGGEQQQQQQQQRPQGGLHLGNGTSAPSSGRATLGRAIIKGSGPMGTQVDAAGKGPKQFPQHPPQVLRSDVDMVAKLLEQQRLLSLQQQQQRGVAPPPPPGVLGMVRNAPPPAPPQTMKLPPMMRPTGMPPQPGQGQAPPVSAPRAGAPLKGSGPPMGPQRGGGGPAPSMEMLQQALAHGLHPLTFQHLVLSVVCADGKSGAHGGPGRPGMVPGSGMVGATPANLAKWFGSDVLHQPTMPPVPHQKALLVEEVERQQQQATTVKN
ncbi:unnamed protein product, partial [Ixodes hexagonus]